MAQPYAKLLSNMGIFSALRTGILLGLTAAALLAQKPAIETPGLPARATAADYQAKAIVGNITIAAEFTGHSVPTAQGPLTAEDYVVVETALFGAADGRMTVSTADFTLRINGRKVPIPSQPFGLVGQAVKDPEYEPPVSAATEKKSKTSLGGSGGGNAGGSPGDPPPSPPPIPIEVRRAMAQRVQKSALPQGDRALPQAGLLFFQYRGKVEGIQSIELIYSGVAGKATIDLMR